MERYSSLFRLPKNLYIDTSPLLIVAGALLKDNQTGRIIAQLKFRSLSEKAIIAVKVKITAYDISKIPLDGVVDYQYLDLSARYGTEFGSNQAVLLPDNAARSYSVAISEVIFEDNRQWLSDDNTAWAPLPKQKLLANALADSELVEQYRRETTSNAQYEPLTYKDLWLCSCGTANKGIAKLCSNCHIGKDPIFSELNVDSLKQNLDTFRKKQLEIQRNQEQHTKKIKKIVLIILIVIVASVVAGVLYVQVLAPMLKYNSAISVMKEGKYEDAIAAFSELGDYSDSATKIEECALLQKEEKYQAGLTLLKNGDYNSAISTFQTLTDYKDSKKKIIEAEYLLQEEEKKEKYQKAVALLNNGDYESAIYSFNALGDYKDSRKRFNEAYYKFAETLAQNGDYQAAIEHFNALGDYEDSKAKIEEIKELQIQNIYNLIADNQLDDAWSAYGELTNIEITPLSEDDFIVSGQSVPTGEENILSELLETTVIWYYFDSSTDPSKADVISTSRGIHIGKTKLEVLLAYGNDGESGSFATNSNFYDNLDDEAKSAAIEQCKTYLYYSFRNCNLYFYFDINDEVSFIVFSNNYNVTNTHTSATAKWPSRAKY